MLEKQGMKVPRAYKTGTTIVGLVYKVGDFYFAFFWRRILLTYGFAL
jgi:hypothetical protein